MCQSTTIQTYSDRTSTLLCQDNYLLQVLLQSTCYSCGLDSWIAAKNINQLHSKIKQDKQDQVYIHLLTRDVNLSIWRHTTFCKPNYISSLLKIQLSLVITWIKSTGHHINNYLLFQINLELQQEFTKPETGFFFSTHEQVGRCFQFSSRNIYYDASIWDISPVLRLVPLIAAWSVCLDKTVQCTISSMILC